MQGQLHSNHTASLCECVQQADIHIHFSSPSLARDEGDIRKGLLRVDLRQRPEETRQQHIHISHHFQLILLTSL